MVRKSKNDFQIDFMMETVLLSLAGARIETIKFSVRSSPRSQIESFSEPIQLEALIQMLNFVAELLVDLTRQWQTIHRPFRESSNGLNV